jgi:hypothetical protein
MVVNCTARTTRFQSTSIAQPNMECKHKAVDVGMLKIAQSLGRANH